MTYELKGDVLNFYHGCGRAWAAISNDEVVAIIYMGDYAFDDYRKVESKDRRYKGGVRVKWVALDTTEKFSEYRRKVRNYLSRFGEVKSGTLSCREFIVYG